MFVVFQGPLVRRARRVSRARWGSRDPGGSGAGQGRQLTGELQVESNKLMNISFDQSINQLIN